MDDFYDFESARGQLEAITKERTSLKPQLQLSTFAQDIGGLNTSVVQHLPAETIKWRLTKPSDGSDELDEVVLRVQGVLCEKNLPPLKIGNRGISTQAKYLTQSVTLSGFNLDNFAKCIQSIHAVDKSFSRHLDACKIKPWAKETYLEFDAVTFSNRYFTDVSRHSYMQGIPFTATEDPSGKLADLSRDSSLLHCEENQVKYFILQNGRTSAASSTIFVSGDLVEVLVSFVVVQSRNQYTLKPILRALTMLDYTERENATSKRNKKNIQITPAPSRFRLKRKVGYDYEEDAVNTEGELRGMSRLTVNKNQDISMTQSE